MRLYNVDRCRKDNDGVSVDNVILFRKDYDHACEDDLCSNYANLVSVSNTLRAISNDTSAVLFTIIAKALWRR
ncbi:MAG: hypothetical protein DLM72_10175 [Candidatus Nitrosopolaris wilkensis]|nr:MAG: hypothetical protein DLM72_10175 [Candidatus Nitrosopolaris wilkensis]